MSTSAVGRSGKQSLATKIFFGAGGIYGGGALVVVGIFYLFFLTEVAGLNPGLAGMVFMIGKVWDAVSDPLMGYLSDRTRSKYGRRRIYFLVGIIPVAVTFFLLWTVPPFESQLGSFIYFVVMTLLFNTVITMVMVPYHAILPEMSPDYNERSSLIGYRMVFSNTASLLAAALPPIIIEQFAGPVIGYQAMGLIFGIFFALPWLGVFYFSSERRAEPVREGFTLFNDAADTMRNFSFRMLVGLYLITYLAMDVIMAVMVYFLTYIFGITGFGQSLILGMLLLFQVVALPFFVYIAKKYDKRTAYLIGAVICFCMIPALFFLSQNTPLWLLYLVACIIGAGTAGAGFIPWAMLPDVLDVDEMVTGKHRQGVYSGVMMFLRKISTSLAIFIVGWMIELSGYVKPVIEGEHLPQPESFLLMIRILVAFLPVLLILIGIYFVRRYPLTSGRHRLVQEELAGRSQSESFGGLSSEVSELAEELYGPAYVAATGKGLDA